MKDRAKVLSSRIRMLEEENKALRVMVDISSVSVEHKTAGTRMAGPGNKSKEVTLGLVMMPLPKGWRCDGQLGSFPITRHGQNYVAVHLVKED
jgi:hypothetical protein